MSYSRWGNSRWYTFWTTMSPEIKGLFPSKKVKNGQLFEICDDPVHHISYGELTNKPINKTLSEIQLKYNCTNEELDELKGYLLAFKVDVDNEFKLNSRIMDVYYTHRNNIYKLIKFLK